LVLANQLEIFRYLVGFLSVFLCLELKAETLEHKGLKIELTEKDCTVKSPGIAPLKLKLLPPCFFVNDESKVRRVRIEYLSDLKLSVALVGGTPSQDSMKAEIKLGKGVKCGSRHQGVLFSAGKWKLGEFVNTPTAVCSQFLGADQSHYWMAGAWKDL
jgi:hypothetical protein